MQARHVPYITRYHSRTWLLAWSSGRKHNSRQSSAFFGSWVILGLLVLGIQAQFSVGGLARHSADIFSAVDRHESGFTIDWFYHYLQCNSPTHYFSICQCQRWSIIGRIDGYEPRRSLRWVFDSIFVQIRKRTLDASVQRSILMRGGSAARLCDSELLLGPTPHRRLATGRRSSSSLATQAHVVAHRLMALGILRSVVIETYHSSITSLGTITYHLLGTLSLFWTFEIKSLSNLNPPAPSR